MEDNTENTTPVKVKRGLGCLAKLAIFFAILSCIAIAALIMLYGYYNQEVNKPINLDDNKIVTFTIEKGMGVDEIANLLVDKKLISNANILKIYRLLNPGKVFQAGYYRIDTTDLSMIDLVSELQSGSFSRKLTFIEGWRIEQYHDYLTEMMGKDFADKFQNSKFVKEGYMFPDTYIIEADYAPENLASWMKNTFDKRVTQDLIDQAGLKGMTLDQVVILASIVEREMNVKKERPIVAGILIKRWQNGWPIQADATLQYAKGTSDDWWPIVTRSDYKNLDSEYNSYTNKDLPPTPICNPGIDSIKAVIEYKESPYWFYINDAEGNTHYAKTLDEHNQNVARYLK